MFNLELIIRDNIKSLIPYSTAREESKAKTIINLDANENPFISDFNRYPESIPHNVISVISKVLNIDRDSIFIGSGSDEIIDLIIRLFCVPSKDSIIVMEPSYGYYEVSAVINDINVKKVELLPDFSLNSTKILSSIDKTTKIIFICSPNNPTGNLFNRDQILSIVEKFNGIVVIDEAYIDFSSSDGFISYVSTMPNLVVIRTLSKSKGMAAIRVGYAVCSNEIVNYLQKIKYPYNISFFSQKMALKALLSTNNSQIKTLINERESLAFSLSQLTSIERVYPSETNFLLVKFKDSLKAYNSLVKSGVTVRDRSGLKYCDNCLRITIGTPIENQYLLNILEGKSEPKYERGVILSRESRETNISLKIYKHDVWGCSISTGIPFLDHMLEIFSLHSGLSIELKAFGDTNVDYHHTVEDCAILIGKAIREIYRDRGDYQRYAYVLPMDESNTTLSIDLCGRFYLKWDVKFTEERVGDLPTRLIYHFFYTLCANAQLSLHVNTYGEDSHHMIESIFKAFSKSLGLALSNSLVDNGMQPSSKGLID